MSTRASINWQRFHHEVSQICEGLGRIADELRGVKTKQFQKQLQCWTKRIKQRTADIPALPRSKREKALEEKFYSESTELVKLHRAVYLAAVQCGSSTLPAVDSMSDCADLLSLVKMVDTEDRAKNRENCAKTGHFPCQPVMRTSIIAIEAIKCGIGPFRSLGRRPSAHFKDMNLRKTAQEFARYEKMGKKTRKRDALGARSS